MFLLNVVETNVKGLILIDCVFVPLKGFVKL